MLTMLDVMTAMGNAVDNLPDNAVIKVGLYPELLTVMRAALDCAWQYPLFTPIFADIAG